MSIDSSDINSSTGSDIGSVESAADVKKDKGQFYTTNCAYIFSGLNMPPKDIRCIIEPFTGKGNIVKWIKGLKGLNDIPIEMYDIDPKYTGAIKRDTLLDPPDYSGSWVITNPPYLARNKSKDKRVYDLYNTNDLYKCFILSLCKQSNCRGGLIIVSSSFFLSPRDIDVRCRNEFMSKFKINKVKYFEETVFEDTPTTVVAIDFEKSNKVLHEQIIEWIFMPSGTRKSFKMSSLDRWIVSGNIYNLKGSVKVRRHIAGQKLNEGEYQTFITLHAIDSGKEELIKLEYRKDHIYPAKESSRTYATLITNKELSDQDQKKLCDIFNDFLSNKRYETHSLFLPPYRESKDYARKRIPFDLVYNLVSHIINDLIENNF